MSYISDTGKEYKDYKEYVASVDPTYGVQKFIAQGDDWGTAVRKAQGDLSGRPFWEMGSFDSAGNWQGPATTGGGNNAYFYEGAPLTAPDPTDEQKEAMKNPRKTGGFLPSTKTYSNWLNNTGYSYGVGLPRTLTENNRGATVTVDPVENRAVKKVAAVSEPVTSAGTPSTNQNTAANPFPGYSGANIIDPNETDVSKLTAKLLRAQFDEWKTTFKPIELKTINDLSFVNPSVLTNAVSDAKGATENAYDTLAGVQERSNAALGIVPSTRQTATVKRLSDLSRAAAVAGAQNTARANVRSQDEQILLGITPNYNIQK